MKITLPLAASVYNLHDRIAAVDPNAGKNCRGGNIYIPTAAEEAGNAGVSVLIGAANAARTAVDQPEYPPFVEGDNYNIPQSALNQYSLKTRDIQASVNDAVITLSLLYA